MRRERGPYRYRRLQMLEGMRDDAYWTRRKPRVARCPQCGAVYRGGRWRWAAAPGAPKLRCPACRRIAEGSPAGYVSLSGGFFGAHRGEVLARIRNCERKENSTHPLERIMSVRNAGGGTLVTTTSVHLARRIAHALESAFKGSLHIAYNHHDNLLRVRWSRSAG